jgi:hypothetical protein
MRRNYRKQKDNNHLCDVANDNGESRVSERSGAVGSADRPQPERGQKQCPGIPDKQPPSEKVRMAGKSLLEGQYRMVARILCSDSGDR